LHRPPFPPARSSPVSLTPLASGPLISLFRVPRRAVTTEVKTAIQLPKDPLKPEDKEKISLRDGMPLSHTIPIVKFYSSLFVCCCSFSLLTPPPSRFRLADCNDSFPNFPPSISCHHQSASESTSFPDLPTSPHFFPGSSPYLTPSSSAITASPASNFLVW